MYKLSIITVNLNNKLGLLNTIENILSLNHREYFEFIIIDGNSNDGSKQIIESKKKEINYWISEPDTGIYNAMNKGIKVAKGEYILFMNSGDTFHKDFSLNSFNCYYNQADILYGDVHKPASKFQEKEEIKKIPKNLTFNFFYNDTLPHQSCFIKKVLFDKYGPYDESLKITSDWCFFIITLCKNNHSYKHIGETVSTYDTNGLSSDFSLLYLHKEERKQVIQKNFPLLMEDYELYNKLLFYSKFNSSKSLYKIIDKSKITHRITNVLLNLLKKIKL